MRLSSRARMLKPSPTLAITAKAKQLRAQGIDVIGFGAGEPDFDTPAHAVRAAVEALEAGETRYTPAGGTAELKQAVCRRIAGDYGMEYGPTEVTVSCGAKHTLYNLFQVLLDPGDEVIVPAPYWVSYPEQVRLAGGSPVVIPTREADGFRMQPEALEAALTPRTRAVVINSPSNPTGALYRAEHLEALADVIRGRDLVVVSDDIYHRLVYGDERFVSILEVAPDLRDRTVIVNGVSKTYAMTGWRIGYAAGPAEVIRAMEALQSQSTSNPTSFAQKGAVAALIGDQACVEEMRRAFARRRDLIVEALNRIPGVTCRRPEGAFYVFPNVSGLFGRRWGDRGIGAPADLAAFLLDEARVAVVPGEAFGSSEHLRMSYATSEDAIREGVGRFAEAVGRLST
ncbi:pyridoxal phosphate-dependent aminotransferase [Deferrisoma camini]|uniref:pyridoxal phosphate-dependent aminotransferase n=1 Tax=Deferrisoma camini TaxID=1035120 RepID=UPI00046D2168|nr:pyridoxal phosphate-dependent aminotransferase [Deferrisoma camini]